MLPRMVLVNVAGIGAFSKPSYTFSRAAVSFSPNPLATTHVYSPLSSTCTSLTSRIAMPESALNVDLYLAPLSNTLLFFIQMTLQSTPMAVAVRRTVDPSAALLSVKSVLKIGFRLKSR